MARPLLNLIDFGNEAGDDVDYADLYPYFYAKPDYLRYTACAQKLSIATGKKGVGKSALVRWIEGRVQQLYPDDLVIWCRGADLARSRFALSDASPLPADRIHDWMIRLCAIANRQLATRIGLALSDHRISLVEAAELEGFKSRNLVGCLLDRLGKLIPGGAPEKKGIVNEIATLKRNQSIRLWILIDDLDATFQNTAEELLELSTCFTAMRYLVQNLKGVIFRATLRTDVWPIIRRYDESLDKLEQYVHEIEWSREEFLGILYKRVKSQFEALSIEPPEILPSDPEDKVAKAYLNMVVEPEMEWAQKIVPNYQVFYTLSYTRPRWGIQLCKLAQARAIQMRDPVIRKNHIDEVWGEFGTKRIADLVAEHKHQCREVHELISAFRGADRLMNRDRLFDWIKRRVVPHVNTRIEGRDIKSPREIAAFLYRIGFIVARSDNEEGFEHYHFDQMPDFLTSRTDEDFNVAWEIHPCYREALDIKKVDRSHRARFGRMRS